MPNLSQQTLINVFNGKMERTWMKAIQAAMVAPPADFEAITTVQPMNARIEIMPFMGPAGGLHPYEGKRFYERVDGDEFAFEAFEYDYGMSVDLRDIRDDKVSDYPAKLAEAIEKAGRPFDAHEVWKLIALGASVPCYDQTAFFATSHRLGTTPAAPATGGFSGGGGNALTFTSTETTDGKQYQLIIFLTTNKVKKPVILGNRRPLEFHSSMGYFQSYEEKKIKYILDKEIGLALGMWYYALQITITNTPGINDLKNLFDGASSYMRKWQAPVVKGAAPQWIHQNVKFYGPGSAKDITVVTDMNISPTVAHLQKDMNVAITPPGFTGGLIDNNFYYGAFNVINVNELNLF